MAFERPTTPTPAAVHSLEVRLRVWPGRGDQRAIVRIMLQDASGAAIPELALQTNLAPHITSQQISELESFVGMLVQKAEEELL